MALAAVAPLPMRGQTGDLTIFTKYRTLFPAMDEIDGLIAARQFDQARERIKVCLAQVPDHFEAQYDLAILDYEGKNYAGALEHIVRSKATLAKLARLYEAETAARASAQAQTQASLEEIVLEADQGPGMNGCQTGYVNSMKVDLSREKRMHGPMAGAVLPFSMPKEYHFLHANCLFRLGRNDEAEAQYRAALQLDPAYGHAWNNLINLLWVERKTAAARTCIQQAEEAKVQIAPGLRKEVLSAGK
jgi:tetratricopeptide (TPR) repeat protein